MISRLTAEKGIHYLIDAYNRIKTDKNLVIAGDTSDTDDYVAHIKPKWRQEIRILYLRALFREKCLTNCTVTHMQCVCRRI